ncbi:hypothetical protein AURDEDRAFT_184642 [Auricularia subglabra TFB-10046 SS5]|nr:hypothetical protein AURDEDRAFT_184642 [Auricularia subglabra TFB-10046 SS5]
MAPDAAALKAEGNALFQKARFAEAHAKYTEAIAATAAEDVAGRTVLYSNRAQCGLNLKRWSDAKFDAAEALLLDRHNQKAWVRLGRANLGARLYRQTRRAYDAASLVCTNPGQKEILSQALNELEGLGLVADDKPEAPSPEAVERAARLKEETNALLNHTSPSDYKEAFVGFTLALVFDPTSAALYCNRSYCGLSLELWLAAAADAQEAILLDNSYAKAWARLGASLLGNKEPVASEYVFKHALLLLRDKPEPLSPADARLKDSIEQSLRVAQSKTPNIETMENFEDDSPWRRARGLLKNDYNPSEPSTWYSCAWTITTARTVFLDAARDMSESHLAVYHGHESGWGKFGAIENLSNSFNVDVRAFYLDIDDWLAHYYDQVIFEKALCKSFEQTDPRSLFEAVRRRERDGGGWGDPAAYTSLRMAVAVTIRSKYTDAVLEHMQMKRLDIALELYKFVVDFIELGRRAWPNVPKEQRGAIFEPTFLLAVERNYLACLKARYLANERFSIPDRAGILEQLGTLAEGILQQLGNFGSACRIPNSSDQDPLWVLAFMFYPEAAGHAGMGFWNYHRARKSDSIPEIASGLRSSIEHYRKAAELYASNDELRTGTSSHGQ